MILKPYFFLVVASTLIGLIPASGAEPEGLARFSAGPAFAYGSWEGRVKAEDGVLVVGGEGVTNAGGCGVFAEKNLVPYAGHSPAIRVRVGTGNQAGGLRVLLMDDQQRTATWHYSLEDLPADASDFRLLTPRDGAPLSLPNEVKDGEMIDLAAIRQVQVQGDWAGDKPIVVKVSEVVLVPENEALKVQRQARARQLEEERERSRQAKAAARAAIRHVATSPEVVHVGAVARDILGITVQAGTVRRFGIVPYEPMEGDRIQEGDYLADAIFDGKIVREPTERILIRRIDGKETKAGYLVGGRDGKRHLVRAEQLEGDPLELLTVDDADSYRVSSPGAAGMETPVPPVRVMRKSFVTDRTMFPDGQVNEGKAVRHVIYLQLPQPLEEGRSYRIEFPGLNVREAAIVHVHDSRTVRSEAIHASHIGYRPDDPFKKAFLSIWLGNGGGYQHSDPGEFELLDEQGQAVFRGPIRLLMAKDGTEQMRVEKNYSGTAVHGMDFSAFRTPGTYRVRVPGLGVSYPLTIAATAWQEAFLATMHGFLSQRASIELGPPFTTYRKPLNFHERMGIKAYHTTLGAFEAEDMEGDWFPHIEKARTEEVVPETWGGYMDAGDFDRHFNHLHASFLHLELFELFPEYFSKLRLALPPAEAGNQIPDLLDETLWNTDLYRRLQTAEGGIRGGVESTAHPRSGEPSWLDSLVLMAYAPDSFASYLYAATAAKTARLLRPYDEGRSREFAASAVKAWNWAEANQAACARKVPERRHYLGHLRAHGAAELLWLTGEAKYNAAFAESTILNGKEGGLADQAGALFTYARLPEGLGDPVLKQKAVEMFRREADVALAFGQGNVFGITTSIPSLPEMGWVGYFTVPEMIAPVLPRAHALTGEGRYLEAAVRATNFTAGANPQNMTFTTGLGHDYPRNPLQLDHRYSNQEPPRGITLYGATDPARNEGFNTWAYIWVLGNHQMPSAFAWPATEAFCDIFLWPAMTEYTIRQTMGPTSYYWGYLAARAEQTGGAPER